jgi:nicotinamide riboside transporter PnuC
MPEVTNPSAFKEQSLGKQALFFAITFGFYGLYWWHKTHHQLSEGTDADFDPTMRTVGLFVPVYNLIVFWKNCHAAEAVTDQDGPILFLFLLVFAPVMWYMVQSGMNEIAAHN